MTIVKTFIGIAVVLVLGVTVSPAFANKHKDKPDKLGKLSCTHDQIAKYDEAQARWVCAADETGDGNPQWVVRDAEGNPFGQVVDVNDSLDRATIVVELAGKRLLLSVSSSGGRPVRFVSGAAIVDSMLREAPDCSDGPWYRASAFDATPRSFLIGFDSSFFTVQTRPFVVNLVEPAGPTVVLEPQYFSNGAICQGPLPLDPIEVIGAITIVSRDVLADSPAPYTLRAE
jgi:hypothetical protein